MLENRKLDTEFNFLKSNRSPTDYLKFDEATQAGLVEIRGRRPEQQDTLVVSTLPGFDKLTAYERYKALETTIAKMQETYGHEEAGSTVCVATAWIDESNTLQAVSTHLGDSEAYIIVLNQQEVCYIQRLNKTLHDLYNDQERSRIENTNRYIFRGRVNGCIAVSRAIGDKIALAHPTDHLPDIDILSGEDGRQGIKLLAHQFAFLVIGCDGLFEKFKLGATNKNTFIASHVFNHHTHPQPSTAIAKTLVRSAFEDGSGDNISVAVVPITCSTPVSAAVFDGHGITSVVSKGLEQDFYPTLKRCAIPLPGFSEGKTATPIAGNNHIPMLPTLGDNKMEFLANLDFYLNNKDITREDILYLFAEIKKKDGQYSFIHQQRHPTFDSLRLFFKSNRNNGEENFWHTASYQSAIKKMKEAYLKNQGTVHKNRQSDEAAFIDYFRGNSPIHFAKTTTRMKFK